MPKKLGRNVAKWMSEALLWLRDTMHHLAIVLLASLLPGCVAMIPRDALPEVAATYAQPEGFHNIRYWGDEVPNAFVTDPGSPGPMGAPLIRSEARRPLTLLAISGGAEDGAFGAGLLAGWSHAGNRPAFDLVTGVSSGALIAPLVFLGRERDSQLREIFTKYGRRDIFAYSAIRPIWEGSALVDSSPLARLIEKYVDRELVRQVARERSKGRLLLIGTTNLDAQRPVLWDMGRIATSDNPDAIDLFRKVLLASATVPGVFAPVRIKVRVGGKDYDEMHVDGGVTRQVFIAPSTLHLFSDVRKTVSGARLFVIRNGRIEPQWQPVNADLLSITQRSISTLIKNQGIGDLYRIYAIARQNRVEFNLASIPANFNVEADGAFDQQYMVALFEQGYRMAKDRYPWARSLPDLQIVAPGTHQSGSSSGIGDF